MQSKILTLMQGTEANGTPLLRLLANSGGLSNQIMNGVISRPAQNEGVCNVALALVKRLSLLTFGHRLKSVGLLFQDSL